MIQFRYLLPLLAVASPSYADSWLDKVKSSYKDVEDKIEQKVEQVVDETFSSEEDVEVKPAKALPTDLPAHWQFSYFREPQFGSNMVVMETGLKHKDTILLVHGLGTLAMRDWVEVIPELEKRYHVVAIDLPGFGASAVPNGRYSPTHYAHAVAAVVERFARQSLKVVGHSMGGAVSLRFADLYPDKLEKLVLVDAAGILEKTAFVKHLSAIPVHESKVPSIVRKQWAQLNDFSSSLVELGTLNDSVSEVLQESDFTWNALLSDAPNMNAALSLVEEDFNQAVRRLKVPTEVIWGAMDTVAPLRTGKVVDALLPMSRLHVMHHAGHVPMKSHTQEFLGLLETALTQAMPSEQERLETQLSSKEEVFGEHLVCKNQDNKVFRGYFASMKLDNCTNAKLMDVTTTRLYLKDSLVEAENLTLEGAGVALEAKESVLRVTNGHFSGKNTIKVSGSRLDLAGVSVQADNIAVKSGRDSHVILSLSELNTPRFQGLVHGSYELEQNTLDLYIQTQ